MFDIQKKIFSKVGEILRFETPQTQRENASNFTGVCIEIKRLCGPTLLEVADKEFEMNTLWNYVE